MAKKIILISSLPVCIVLAVIAFIFVGIGRGQLDLSGVEKAKENIISLIEAGYYAEAESAMEKMINDFSTSPNLRETLYSLVQKYELVNKFEEAKRVYQQIAQKYPDSPYARIGVVKEEVTFLIYSQKYSDAQNALDKMIFDFNDNPHLAESLYWIAEEYKWQKQYKNANAVYQQIVGNFPDGPWAQKAGFGASKTQVLSLIQSKDYEGAGKSLDKLTADFEGYEDLPETLYWIAGEFNWAKQFEEANGVYQQIIEKYPDGSWADKAKLGVSRVEVFSLIESQDYNNAESAVDKMVVDFADHPDLPETLYWIADRFRWSNNHFEDAKQVYQQLVQMYPDSPWFDKAQLGISRVGVLSLIVAEDYNQADMALDEMIADFNGHPLLTEAVFLIGDEYYNEAFDNRDESSKEQSDEIKGKFLKAAKVYEKIIDEMPESIPYTPDAWYLSGVCFYYNEPNYDNYQKAIDCFENLVDKWPDNQHAASALGLTGVCYDKLQMKGLVKGEEAAPLSESAYKTLIDQYFDSDCPFVEYACTNLAWKSFKKGQFADTAFYFELLLQKLAVDDPRRPDVLFRLAGSYEQLGQVESATRAYQEFLKKARPDDKRINKAKSFIENPVSRCEVADANKIN